jgi:hypothetical protein
MGILKKNRSTQKPAGYLTPNITDNLGNVSLTTNTKNQKTLLGSLVYDKNITKIDIGDDNIYTIKNNYPINQTNLLLVATSFLKMIIIWVN